MGINITLRGGAGDMLRLTYDPDLNGKFDTDEIEITGAKGVVPLSYYLTTKRLFSPAGASSKGAGVINSTNFVWWGSVYMDTLGHYTVFNLRVPPDYHDTPKIYVVYGRVTAEPIFDFYISWAATNELRNATTEGVLNLTCNQANANNKIGIMNIGATLAGLTKDDMMAVKVIMDTNNVYVLGVIFEYNTI